MKKLKLIFALTDSNLSATQLWLKENHEGAYWNRRRVYCLLDEDCYYELKSVLSNYGWELTDKEFKRNSPDFPDADELIVCSFERQ
jgi:hypothetical protein